MRRMVLGLLVFLASAAAWADAGVRFENVQRIVAFADVHGAYDELVSVLRETQVVDEALRWRGGTTHLVSLGDLLDRGPASRRVLDLLMRLEGEAQEAGGALHLVLGNHEVMNLSGDLRYVSEAEYATFAGVEDDALRDAAWQQAVALEPLAVRAAFEAAHPPGWFGHRQAFSPQGRYGAWLLSKPFVIVVNDTAFAHGGLPPFVARLGLEETNRTLHAQFARFLAAQHAADAVALETLSNTEVFTQAGPTWFRGQALCNSYTQTENLEAALAALGATRVVVGHTVSPDGRVLSRFDGRVMLLDTGMLQPVYRGTPSALVYEQGAWTVAYAGQPGKRALPAAPSRAVGPRPRALDDDALERWLVDAEVTGVEELAAGITNPQRLTLRRDGLELRAVFKRLSTDFGVIDRKRALDIADRFQYEIAAYRLDRLIGLDMVPVTVPRTVNGHPGIVQFWIDDSINLREMLERQLQPSGWCEALPQYNLMNVFDVLVHNTDRTQENALLTRDWMLVLIDHSRAFTTELRLPRLLYKGELAVPPALAARLAALDRDALQRELGPWLHKRQIDAILKRRDRKLSQQRAVAGGRAAGR
ncbi:MAG: metallophosphoesterase [Gammaproteobacteria bacterium]